MGSFTVTIDVRTLEKGFKKDIIFKAFEELSVGETMELVNDHDPKPLYQQFMLNYSEKFVWEYFEQGQKYGELELLKISLKIKNNYF